MYQIFFIHSSVCGHLGCFHVSRLFLEPWIHIALDTPQNPCLRTEFTVYLEFPPNTDHRFLATSPLFTYLLKRKKKLWVMLDCFTSFTFNVLWNFHLSLLHLTSSPPFFSSFLSSFKAQLKSSFSVVLFPTLQSIWPSCLHLQASLLLLLLSADLILLSVEVCREKGIRTGTGGWDVKAYWCWARVSLDKTLRRSQAPWPILTVQWPPGSEDRLMINDHGTKLQMTITTNF